MKFGSLLAGRSALVLGIDDIGEGIARCFAHEGARVTLADPSAPARAADVARDIGSAMVVSDDEGVSPARQLEHWAHTLVGRVDPLDTLVCNLLPDSRPRALAEDNPESFVAHTAAIAATVAAMRAALPSLRASGRGRIVLVAHRYGSTSQYVISAIDRAYLLFADVPGVNVELSPCELKAAACDCAFLIAFVFVPQ